MYTVRENDLECEEIINFDAGWTFAAKVPRREGDNVKHHELECEEEHMA